MKKDILKITSIIAFVISVIAFNDIKKSTQNQISKGVSFMCKNIEGEISIKY